MVIRLDLKAPTHHYVILNAMETQMTNVEGQLILMFTQQLVCDFRIFFKNLFSIKSIYIGLKILSWQILHVKMVAAILSMTF